MSLLPVAHLFVREHGAERGAPVHRHLGLVGEPLLEEPAEDPLRPAHVARVGGVDLAVPVVGEAERLELLAVARDVARGRHARVLAGLHRVLLGGQTERVPAHRVEHVEAAHALVAREHVGRDVALRVTDVQPLAGRVREHVEHVVLRPRGIDLGAERRAARAKGAATWPRACAARTACAAGSSESREPSEVRPTRVAGCDMSCRTTQNADAAWSAKRALAGGARAQGRALFAQRVRAVAPSQTRTVADLLRAFARHEHPGPQPRAVLRGARGHAARSRSADDPARARRAAHRRRPAPGDPRAGRAQPGRRGRVDRRDPVPGPVPGARLRALPGLDERGRRGASRAVRRPHLRHLRGRGRLREDRHLDRPRRRRASAGSVLEPHADGRARRPDRRPALDRRDLPPPRRADVPARAERQLDRDRAHRAPPPLRASRAGRAS